MSMHSRKAVFFTVSVLFLIPAVIALWALSAQTINLEKPLLLERIYELSSSVSYTLKDIMRYYADVSIVIENASNGVQDNVTFIENISTNQSEWSKNYIAVIGNFTNFAQTQEPALRLNLSNLQDKQAPAVIMPQNITYTRKWQAGNVTLKVSPEVINFNSYDVLVNSSIRIANVTMKAGAAGSFSLTVTAVDNASFKNVTKLNIDPASAYQINITFTNNNKTSINYANGVLQTWTNSLSPAIISTKVGSLQDMGDKVSVAMFRQAINISFPSLSTEKILSVEFSEA